MNLASPSKLTEGSIATNIRGPSLKVDRKKHIRIETHTRQGGRIQQSSFRTHTRHEHIRVVTKRQHIRAFVCLSPIICTPYTSNPTAAAA